MRARHTIPYHTIPYHTIQYHTVQYNTIQIQYNTIQYNTIQYNTIQYNTIQYNTIQYNTIQYNTIQHNTIQYNTRLCPHRTCVHRGHAIPSNSTFKITWVSNISNHHDHNKLRCVHVSHNWEHYISLAKFKARIRLSIARSSDSSTGNVQGDLISSLTSQFVDFKLNIHKKILGDLNPSVTPRCWQI